MPSALVLSGAGMFGAYQAGAWNVLSRSFQPDMIVGTSAGAINGWAIAGGCSPADLVSMWLDPATAGLMRLRLPLIPWKGFIDPSNLARHVRDIFARFRPRIPFSLTVVELPRLRLVRVPGEQVTPDHLMASCAIPWGYPPVRINGKLYVDGGLLDILPVWAANEMGATRAIAVNALPLMPSRSVRAVLWGAHAVGQKPPGIDGLHVVSISPTAPLGSARDAVTWNSDKVRRWIEQGEQDAALIKWSN